MTSWRISATLTLVLLGLFACAQGSGGVSETGSGSGAGSGSDVISGSGSGVAGSGSGSGSTDPICGDGIVATEGNKEKCDTAASGALACTSTCEDNNACTQNVFNNPGPSLCQSYCTFPEITQNVSNDGCCRLATNPFHDYDCQVHDWGFEAEAAWTKESTNGWGIITTAAHQEGTKSAQFPTSTTNVQHTLRQSIFVPAGHAKICLIYWEKANSQETSQDQDVGFVFIDGNEEEKTRLYADDDSGDHRGGEFDWRKRWANITAYSGKRVELQIRFTGNGDSEQSAWFVDNIYLSTGDTDCLNDPG